MQNLFSIQTVAIFVVIALPGIVGQLSYALTISRPIDALQNQLVSIFAFGCLNFVVASYPLYLLFGFPLDPQKLTFGAWVVAFGLLVMLPALTGWALARGLKALVSWGVIGQQLESEWDFAINWARDPKRGVVYFHVVTIDFGAFVAEFDRDSFATKGNVPRGLFCAKTWELDEEGNFDPDREAIAMLFSEDQIARISMRSGF